MAKYILKRLLMMIPVLLGVAFIIFAILTFTPGDPVEMMLPDGATEEECEELRESLGLNDNFFVRYFRWVVDAVQLDFGKSYRNNIPVFDEIFSRFPNTVILAVFGISIAVIIGVPIGVISAVKQYSVMDHVSTVVALALTSMPSFFLGMLLMLLFSLKLGWLPATGVDSWKSFILPSVAVASASAATIFRMTRSTMLEVIRQDYINTAKAKGAKESQIVFKHALRNALLPVITVIGIQFGGQLGGAMITETVFAIPGLGALLINSVRLKDVPMVMASVMFVALIAGVVNLVVDILYTFIDPRTKSQFAK